jgi:hypothetical protein
MRKMVAAIAIALIGSGGVAITGRAQTATQAPTTQPQFRKLTGAEVRSAFVGNTSYSPGQYGPKTVTVYFDPNGQVRLRSPTVQDVGTYKIGDDGTYCSKYTKIRDGVETCQTIYQAGSGAYETHLASGSIIKSTIVSGNPEGI